MDLEHTTMSSKLDFSTIEDCEKFLKGHWENPDSKHTHHIPACLYKITSKDLSRETGGKRCGYPNITGGYCQHPPTYSGCLINSKDPVICGRHYKILCADNGWDCRLSRCINVLCDKHNVSMEDRDKLHRYLYIGIPVKRVHSTDLESTTQKRRRIMSSGSTDDDVDSRSCDGSSEDSLNDSFIVDDDESISYESDDEPLCLDLVDSSDDDSVYSTTDNHSNSFAVDEEPIEELFETELFETESIEEPFETEPIETDTNPTDTNPTEPIETVTTPTVTTETTLVKDYPIRIEKVSNNEAIVFKIICEFDKTKNTQFQFEMKQV